MDADFKERFKYVKPSFIYGIDLSDEKYLKTVRFEIE